MLAGLDIILALAALVIGGGLGYYIRKQRALGAINSAEIKAEKIISEAKAKEKNIFIKAQEKSLALLDEKKKNSAATARLTSCKNA